MFTGIIQAVGRIRDNEEIGDGLRIHVEAPELGLDTVKIGDSIAINGACMKVVEVDEKRFKVEVSAESLSKTAGLDGWGYVNLEKAMRLGDRLDGHIVSGHVDGVGEIVSLSGSLPDEACQVPGLQRLGCHQRCFSDDQRSGRYAGRHPHQH